MKKLGTDKDRKVKYHVWEDKNLTIMNERTEQQVSLTKDEVKHLKEVLNAIDLQEFHPV